jgi:hypothetical protein
MKVSKFVAALLPSFTRDDVVEDIRITRMEIKESTMPAYHAAAEIFRAWKWKHEPLRKDLEQFARMNPGQPGNLFVRLDKAFPAILENLDEVEVLIAKTFNQEIAGSGVTYLKANLLQFVEVAGFVSKYARKFLDYAYVVETGEHEDSVNTYLKDNVTQADLEWLSANFVSFCTAFKIASTPSATLRKAIDAIPDVVVSDDSASTLTATHGESKIDPLQLGFIPLWLNPIYHVRMFIAEWQASRYKASQEEMRLLQLRKLNLERLSQGKPDVALSRQIESLSGRIQTLNYKIMKMEKTYG